MNDLHTLHDKASELLVWNLSNRVLAMRSGTGQVSQAVEGSTGSNVICTDTPQEANKGRDSGCIEGES